MGLRLRAVRCPPAFDEHLENGRGSGDRAQYDRQVALVLGRLMWDRSRTNRYRAGAIRIDAPQCDGTPGSSGYRAVLRNVCAALRNSGTIVAARVEATMPCMRTYPCGSGSTT